MDIQKLDLSPMAKRRLSVIQEVVRHPGRRLRYIADGLPYSAAEVLATLNWLWRNGYVSRHYHSHGSFCYYTYYPTEKIGEI